MTNPYIEGFLKIEEARKKGSGNVFTEAKKLTAAQKRELDKNNNDRIDAEDFEMLRNEERVNEAIAKVVNEGQLGDVLESFTTEELIDIFAEMVAESVINGDEILNEEGGKAFIPGLLRSLFGAAGGLTPDELAAQLGQLERPSAIERAGTRLGIDSDEVADALGIGSARASTTPPARPAVPEIPDSGAAVRPPRGDTPISDRAAPETPAAPTARDTPITPDAPPNPPARVTPAPTPKTPTAPEVGAGSGAVARTPGQDVTVTGGGPSRLPAAPDVDASPRADIIPPVPAIRTADALAPQTSPRPRARPVVRTAVAATGTAAIPTVLGDDGSVPAGIVSDDMSFGQAFRAARNAAEAAGHKASGRFTWKGNEYQTNIKGEKFVPYSRQTAVGEETITPTERQLIESILRGKING